LWQTGDRRSWRGFVRYVNATTQEALERIRCRQSSRALLADDRCEIAECYRFVINKSGLFEDEVLVDDRNEREAAIWNRIRNRARR
jgi:hypothetical protein